MAKKDVSEVLSGEDIEEIKEFVSILLLLPAEDRAILLSNANAFKTRRDIERAREKEGVK